MSHQGQAQRTRPPLRIVVKTFAIDGSEESKEIDYFDNSDLIWFRNHCVWAFTNGAALSLYAAN